MTPFRADGRSIYGEIVYSFSLAEAMSRGYVKEVVRVDAEWGRIVEADRVAEAVARRKQALPTTVPNDPEAIAALTEGERQIAAKNSRAAEASFKKVLVKYPDQPRAWFGLGVVAYMDHNAARAKEVFGRLTAGEHAATGDARVLAWSHVYLARIYDYEGNPSVAKTEYESALAVQGGPEEARQAAQKELAADASDKQVARP